jgi:RNA polymerase sigma factor (sigma-70 family)
MPLGERFATTLQAARTGADWAWAEIYRDLAPSVLGYLRGHRASDPEDLAGEVFLQVVRHLANFEGQENDFRAWIFTIAHNRLIDAHRHSVRRPVDALGHEVIERHAPVGDAESEAMQALELEHVLSVIDGLTDDQRSVILLRIIAGLKIDQVAQALGKSATAVKALQRRGLAAIGREISSEAVSP